MSTQDSSKDPSSAGTPYDSLERNATIQVIGLDDGVAHEIQVFEPTVDQFAARLRKVYKERRKQAAREGVSCFRIYDADLPEYAVAIDCYTDAHSQDGVQYLSIAEYAPPASVDPERAHKRFQDVLSVAPVVCGVEPEHVFSRRRVREKGGGQYKDEQGASFVATVSEGSHLFEVDLAQRLDTGLFLDHRLTRALIQEYAAGADFLNLFAYTGSATVYAAAGGAKSTTTVDMSQTYLSWAQRNMELNGFVGAQYVYEKADVLKWITESRRSGRRWDLIFVDPPTFSNSKSMGKRTWEVQRDHAELLIGVIHLLTANGRAIFSCNLRNFKPDLEKLTRYGVEIEDITAETIPFDFARSPKIHHAFVVKRASKDTSHASKSAKHAPKEAKRSPKRL